MPELAKLLGDEQLASWSRIALEAIPDPAADAALIEAAKTLQGKLLVGTINSIGVRRSAEAVDHLAGRLKDPDAEVASAAAVALGQIGGDAATKSLRQALAGATPAVRSAIAEGGILCAERLLAEGKARRGGRDLRRGPQGGRPEATSPRSDSRRDPRPRRAGNSAFGRATEVVGQKQFQIGLSTARELPGREVAEALAAELASTPPERASLDRVCARRSR